MARIHHHSGAGTFTGFLLGAALILALLIGWGLWSGRMPGLPDEAPNMRLKLPEAPSLPAAPNPEPLPLPSPAKPG